MKERISISSDVCNGKPVIIGTRIPIQTILEFMAAGDSVQDVLEEYPSLQQEDIFACLEYASKLMANHFELEPIR